MLNATACRDRPRGVHIARPRCWVSLAPVATRTPLGTLPPSRARGVAVGAPRHNGGMATMTPADARVFWKALMDNASALVVDADVLLNAGSVGRARSLTVLARIHR